MHYTIKHNNGIIRIGFIRIQNFVKHFHKITIVQDLPSYKSLIIVETV